MERDRRLFRLEKWKDRWNREKKEEWNLFPWIHSTCGYWLEIEFKVIRERYKKGIRKPKIEFSSINNIF